MKPHGTKQHASLRYMNENIFLTCPATSTVYVKFVFKQDGSFSALQNPCTLEALGHL